MFNDSSFNVTLEPVPVKFTVQVSADAGAHPSPNGMVWDVKSDDWLHATWQDTLDFWYYAKTTVDDMGDPDLEGLENYFFDKCEHS